MGFGQYTYGGGFSDRKAFTAYDRVTGKRVKTNLNSGEVAHVWARRSQTCGQNGRGNFFFRGDVLYSYGTHFIVAQFVEGAKGRVGVLINSERYSVTTSGQQSQAARAIDADAYPVFTVPGAHIDHVAAMRYYSTAAAEYGAKAKRARSDWAKGYNATRANALIAEARAYRDFFKLAGPAPSDLDSLVAASEAALKAAKAEAKRREAAAKVAAAEAFAQWQAGAAIRCPHAYHVDESGSAYCRAVGDNLETSQGAVVPLAHAVKVLRVLERVRASGKAWTASGASPLRVGHYTVDRIEANGDFKAGCHRFTWARVTEAAALASVRLGVKENA